MPSRSTPWGRVSKRVSMHHAGALEMLVAGSCSPARILAAPAIVGEAAILRSSLPELAQRTATFRALESACMAWRLDVGALQVRRTAPWDFHVSRKACGRTTCDCYNMALAACCGMAG